MKQKKIVAKSLAVSLAVATALSGCSGSSTKGTPLNKNLAAGVATPENWDSSWNGEMGKLPVSEQEQVSAVSAAANEFNRKLFFEILKEKQKEEGANTFVSGYSAFAALATLGCGMEDGSEAETELMKTLGLEDYSLDEIAAMTARTGKALESYPGNKLTVSDSLWISESLPVSDRFKTVYAPRLNMLDAQVFVTDFASQENVDAVNKWVSEATGKMISKMKEEPTPDVIAEIYNAIYFDGKWKKEFDEDDTDRQTFHGSAGESMVDMMHMGGTFSYRSDELYDQLRLEYQNDEFQMNVYLPKDESKTMEQLMTDGSLSEEQIAWIFGTGELPNDIGLRDYDVTLSMPKFTIEDKLLLNQPVQMCGAEKIFDNAEMSALTDDLIYVGKIMQKTKVEVDEKGTKAAATTQVTMFRNMAVMIPEHAEFNMNHPFFFTISNSETGAVLFAGSINNLPQ